MSGTITLPSGDKLITQTETLNSGAIVHREEVVISGTISGRLALPTNSQPAITMYGLPVWEMNDPKRIELTNYGHSGTPLFTSFASAQPISTVAGTVPVSFPSAQSVNISNTPAITFASPQAITLAGTITANIRNSFFSKKTAKIDIGATGSATVVPLVTGKRIKVSHVNIQADRAGSVSSVWLDGTTSLSGTQTYQDREGYIEVSQPPDFFLAPQAGTALVLHVPTTSAAFPFSGGLRGWVSYWDDDSI